MELWELLGIRPGLTAVIGSGGKTSLLRVLEMCIRDSTWALACASSAAEPSRGVWALTASTQVVRANVSGGACGFPDVSFHGVKPWCSSFAEYERYVGVMFAGREEGKGPQTVYIASNAYWEELDVELPVLPDGMKWELAADTWEDTPCPGPLGKQTILRWKP